MTELTCIVCPVGCRLSVTKALEGLKVTGNDCRRGAEYAKDEVTAPKRVLTAVVKVDERERMLPVKTVEAIPKEKIFLAMEEIKEIIVAPPIYIGQVIKENLVGTAVDLVATKNYK